MLGHHIVIRSLGLVCILALGMDAEKAVSQISAHQEKKLRIIVEEAAIRKYPSEMYQAIGKAKKGEVFSYTGLTQSGWYQIHYQGNLAYVKAEHARPIEMTPPAKTEKAPEVLTGEKTAAPAEESTPPVMPEEKRGIPVFWIGVGIVAILLYVIYFIRNLRQQREFEEFLRHKPS